MLRNLHISGIRRNGRATVVKTVEPATRKAGVKVEDDLQVRALLDSQAPVVSWSSQH